jgi:hypothetical protein
VALDGKVASANEGGGRLGASTVPCSGRWLNGRLGVAQRRMRAVHGDQRLEQRSTVMKEQRRMVRGRAEWAVIRRVLRKEERMTSLSDRQRDKMTHGVTAAFIARGVDVAADRHR